METKSAPFAYSEAANVPFEKSLAGLLIEENKLRKAFKAASNDDIRYEIAAKLGAVRQELIDLDKRANSGVPIRLM